jgi:hypothetical protein
VLPTFSASPLPLWTAQGIGYDPLTANEADRALALALQHHAVLTKTRAPSQTAVQPTVLFIERYDAPKDQNGDDNTRRGEVYLYDYTSDTLIHNVIDLANGSVESEQLRGVQLPLTAGEKERSLQLIRDDAELWSALVGGYRRISGETLAGFEQLEVKVSLFLATAMPDQVNPEAARCGEHRCAQVLIFTTDRVLLEILPIVDLSQGRVVQWLSDSWTATTGADPVENGGS